MVNKYVYYIALSVCLLTELGKNCSTIFTKFYGNMALKKPLDFDGKPTGSR